MVALSPVIDWKAGGCGAFSLSTSQGIAAPNGAKAKYGPPEFDGMTSLGAGK
jgi:hypothetical protein